MTTPLKTFGPNLKGRDFAIGDLHGAYSVFLNLLENINFDFEKDRMFSTADLVDRGEKSLECLRLVDEPWFNPVKANHEQMMIEAFTGGPTGDFWVQNGGRWGLEACIKYGRILQATCNNQPMPDVSAEEAEIIELVKKANELPYLITVKNKNGKKYHVIHAELPANSLNLSDADLEDPVKVYKLATTQDRYGDSFLWCRNIFEQFHNRSFENEEKIKRTISFKFGNSTGPFNENLSHIISGHTILQRPMTILGQTDIDTCAYGSTMKNAPEWMGLTCINLDDWTFTLTTPTNHKSVQPFVCTQEDIKNLRSNG